MSIAIPALLRSSAAHRQVLVPSAGTLLQFAAAAGLFGLGAVIYWLARPAGLGGTWIGAAPSLIHPLAMILLCAALLRPHRGALPALCVLWVAINLAFEAGQWAPAARASAAWLNAHCGAQYVCHRTATFFLRGTFDWLDICAAVIAGAAGWGWLRRDAVARGSRT